MIDIHAHILPAVDDGAQDMEIALNMAAMAVESGVTTVAATPHCMDFAKRRNFWDRELEKELESFRKALEKEKIPLEIVKGMEIYGTEKVPRLLAEKRMIGINGSDYPLIEFDFYNFEAQSTEILENVLRLGMRPVVAHPERYIYIQQDPAILNMWVEMGCLLQINKGSLLGRFGRREQALAFELVGRGFAFAVASDAHSHIMRTTWMSDVQQLLREEFSPATAEKLLKTNPFKILKNEKIHWEEPHWFR